MYKNRSKNTIDKTKGERAVFDVGARIKELRTERGLTVNGLANKAGISQSFLRDIELGNKQPTVEYLEYICDALKVSLVDFFDVTDDADTIIKLVSKMTQKQKSALIGLLDEFL